MITFGRFDSNEVKGGEEGMNYYDNLGKGRWALNISEVSYDDEDILDSKLAVIDSALRRRLSLWARMLPLRQRLVVAARLRVYARLSKTLRDLHAFLAYT